MQKVFNSVDISSSLKPSDINFRKRVKKKVLQWNPKVEYIHNVCMVTNCSIDSPILAISDGGTQIDCIPMSIAKDLLRRKVISDIFKLKPPIQLTFGKKGVVSVLDHFIQGNGLLDNVAVGVDIACPLISEINFTKKGLQVLKTNTSIYILRKDGTIVIEGSRNVANNENELWKLDLQLLLSLSHPAKVSNLKCNLIRPQFDKDQIVNARKAQRAFGTSYKAIADTIQNEAIRNVPANLTHDVFRKVSDKDGGGSLAYQLSHHTFIHKGGSGVSPEEIGSVFSVDKIGPYPPSTFGATSAYLFVESATGTLFPFAIKSGTSLIACIQLYCAQMASYGHSVQKGRCDSTSQILPEDFILAMAELKLTIVPAPPQEQFKNPLEASWRTVQEDMSGLLLGQRNLSSSHWFLAMKTACTRRSTVINSKSILLDPTMTPWQLLTKIPVCWDDLVRGFFGGLCKVKTVGPNSNNPLKPMNELAVYICPILNGTHSDAVLLHGNRDPSIRGNVEMLQEYSVTLTRDEYSKLDPKKTEQGRIIEFTSPVNDDFSSLVVSAQSVSNNLDLNSDTSDYTLKSWTSFVNDNGWASNNVVGPPAQLSASSNNLPHEEVPFTMNLRSNRQTQDNTLLASSHNSTLLDEETNAYMSVFNNVPNKTSVECK